MIKKIFISSFGSDAGGIEKSLIEFLRLLISMEYEIDLCLWREPGILFSQIPKQVNIIDSDKLWPGSMRKGKKSAGKIIWYVLFRIGQYMKIPTKFFKKMNKKYDIAISYCQNGYSPYYVIDRVNAKRKYIWYHHGSYEKEGTEKRIDKYYYSKYDKFITVSNANKEMLLKHFPSLESKMDVINNLINEQDIINKSLENVSDINVNEKNIITTVGRVAEEKGQLFAVDVADKLKQTGMEFVWYFIGDGPDLEKCKDKVKCLKLDNECYFLGAKKNPYPYILNARLYVQPSKVEADPITILESKILKKVILASDIPAICESLQNGKLGCIEERDVNKFSESIRQLLVNDIKRKKYLDELNKMESNNKFSIDKINKLLE